MSKIQFITGGAASGKTRWAITYYQACDNVLYLCINKELDKEISDRIAFNNKRNGIEWEIVKDVDDPAKYIDRNHKFTIFDGLGAYVSREMYAACPNPEEMTEDQKKEIEKNIIDKLISLIETVKEINGDLLIITIEPGFSVCPEKREQRLFREILGTVNQRLANICTDVYLSASGIQFKIK